MSDADLERLRERVADLEETVAELTDDTAPQSTTETPPRFGDRRDQAVIETFDVGDRVHISTVRQLYRSRTDISQQATIRRRTKALLQDGPFERTAARTWTYRGEADE